MRELKIPDEGQSADLLAALVLVLLPGLQSAIGVGGSGALLGALARRGVGYIQGVAGPDLASGTARRFDLAISLEQVQRLSTDRALALVSGLTELSDLVLFSGSIPGQSRGRDLTERWQDEWAMEFQKCGFYSIDALRPRLWPLDEIEPVCRQNAILYASLAGLERYPHLLGDRVSALSSLRVVHPRVWSGMRSRAAAVGASRFVPAAIRWAGERWMRGQ